MYIFGDLNPEPSNYWDINIHYFSYDNQDRVIKDSFSSQNFGYHGVFAQYSYDADGNKVGGVYDHKINIHRTNKVWMFLDRDYSVNNPFTASEYNKFDLPVTISTGSNFLDIYFDSVTVKYMCDELPNHVYK